MLANSNQDFSVYVNILFQGAHNFFISTIKPSEHVKVLARKDTLGLDAQIEDSETDSVASEQDSDIEGQLEAFMGQALQGQADNMKVRDSQMSAEDLPRITEAVKHVPMPVIEIFKNQNEFDPVFKVDKKRKRVKDKTALGVTAQPKSEKDSDLDSVSLEESSSGEEEKVDGLDSKASLSHSEETDEELEADKLVQLQNKYIMGMLSRNRELFLFDRQVKMGRSIENWLVGVEDAMRVSVKKHMKNAILRFANQPIEEWIGDYPQQVAISVIHLVIS